MSDVSKPSVEQDTYTMLTKTFYLLDDCDRHFFAEYNLSIRQFWALKHLDEEHGCSMVDLSRVLFTDKSNITSIVDRLERLKLALRIPAVHDRRVILIKLTPEGRQLCDSVSEQHQAHIRVLMKILNQDGLSHLLGYLQAISRNLEVYLERKPHPEYFEPQPT